MQGRIQFEFDTPKVPPYGRIVLDYTNPMWIPNENKKAQSNFLKGPRKQNRIDILDWTLEIKEVSSIVIFKFRHCRNIIYGNKITM